MYVSWIEMSLNLCLAPSEQSDKFRLAIVRQSNYVSPIHSIPPQWDIIPTDTDPN